MPNSAGQAQWVGVVLGSTDFPPTEMPSGWRNPYLTTATAKTARHQSFGSCEPSKTVGFVLFSPRSSHLPLFVQMSPLRSDWSHAGLKGVIPSVLHYSLLGYNFFIPDAVGNNFFSFSPISGFSAEIFAAVVQARGAQELCLHHLA